MVLRETPETGNEAARETQKSITALKVLRHQADGHIADGCYIKAYRRELEIESELRWLAEYLVRQEDVCRREMQTVREGISIRGLRLKCRLMEGTSQQLIDEEDFGEE